MRVVVVGVCVRDVLPGWGKPVGDRAGSQERDIEVLPIEGNPLELFSIPVMVASDRVDVGPEPVEKVLFLIWRDSRPALRLFHVVGVSPHGAYAANPAEVGMEVTRLPVEGFVVFIWRPFSKSLDFVVQPLLLGVRKGFSRKRTGFDIPGDVVHECVQWTCQWRCFEKESSLY